MSGAVCFSGTVSTGEHINTWLIIVTASTVTGCKLVKYCWKIGLGREKSLTFDFKVMSSTEPHEYMLYGQTWTQMSWAKRMQWGLPVYLSCCPLLCSIKSLVFPRLANLQVAVLEALVVNQALNDSISPLVSLASSSRPLHTLIYVLVVCSRSPTLSLLQFSHCRFCGGWSWANGGSGKNIPYDSPRGLF